MVGGKTHILVRKSKIGAHLQQDHAGDRIELGGKAGFLLEALNLADRHIDGAIDLDGLDRGHAC